MPFSNDNSIKALDLLNGRRGRPEYKVAADSAKKARLNRIQTMMQGSDIGKQCVDYLEKTGCEIVFEPTAQNISGFDEMHRKLIMNPAISEEGAALCIIQAACHRRQDRQNNWDMLAEEAPLDKSFFKIIRQADVTATQALFAYEMKEKNPKVMELFNANGYKDVSDKLEESMKESPDKDIARTKAVIQYYHNNDRKTPWMPAHIIRESVCTNFNGRTYFDERQVDRPPQNAWVDFLSTAMAMNRQGGR